MLSPVDAAINVQGLTKTFKSSLPARVVGRKPVHALRTATLTAFPGEIFGLLGPNGAGKSTMVKSILGLVRPGGGTIRLLGKHRRDPGVRRQIGYLPEQAKFPKYLTGRQVVEFFSRLGGLTKAEARKRCDKLLDRVELTDAADRAVGGYSKGMRQRVGLAQALAAGPPDGPPKILILDEPTDGVDPIARKLIRDVLVEAREQGTCVMLNSHLLGELELVCDRCAVMVQGHVAKAGTPSDLAAGRASYRIELPAGVPVSKVEQALGTTIVDHQATLDTGLVVKRPDDTSLDIQTGEADAALVVLDRLRQSNVVITAFRPVRPSLEDVFIETVRENPGPGAFPVLPVDVEKEAAK
ncbi:MAG: ABC transporter ATP-binding protein [Planctomycetota bacterium]